MAMMSNERILSVFGEKSQTTEHAMQIRVESANSNIERVLSVVAKANIEGVSVFEGELRGEGEVRVDVVYLGAEGEIFTTTQTAQLAISIKNDMFFANQTANLFANIISADVENVLQNEVIVSVVVGLTPFVCQTQDLKVFESTNDAIKVKTQTNERTELVAVGNAVFSKDGKIQTNLPVSRVLASSANVVVNQARAFENYVAIEGDVIVESVVALSDGENTTYQTLKIELPFDEQIEANGAVSDAQVLAAVRPVLSSLSVTEFEDKTENGVDVAVKIAARVLVFEKTMFSAVGDAYGTENQTFISTQTYKYLKECTKVSDKVKLESNLLLDADLARIDKVLFWQAPRATTTNTYIADDVLHIEGTVDVAIIYLNDENNQISSYLANIPFAVEHRLAEPAGTDAIVDVDVNVVDLQVTARRGREIFVDAKLAYQATICVGGVDAVVSDVELGEPLLISNSPIKIYYARAGQTIWDVAKDMHVDQETIMRQNPDVEDVAFDGDKKIVFYKQKVK